MWIDRLTESRTTRALELAAQFAEQRHNVLAENLANIDTPNYTTQQLDPQAFQKSLRAALDHTAEKPSSRLELRDNAQFSTDSAGGVRVAPAKVPAANVLFHDGTNTRLEQTLADVTQNSMSYELATTLLRSRFESLLRAIRGRTT
jgi:flagellar basal-body rod protein FlgB